ncbi:hypothetical protein PMG11_01464 [Penicillium brasilianum]|uniref:Uncharacterized protein n=1 Tax=Penicillium brasilianum TaxID=104259 RepID=A0A0F7TFA7_PENBI|nr:hypothetical protein PMG11_01464 [Penicillium brasilianum]
MAPLLGRKTHAKEATAANLPPLLVGQHHTESSALHSLYFLGPLSRWSNFLRAVEATSNTQTWSPRVIKYTQRLDEEAVQVGDEHGVQGRFQQSLGSLMGHVFKAQSIDLHFADFKCLGSSYTDVPDVILKNSNNELKVIGELKAPWIEQHKLGGFYNEDELRQLLAQPINYMQSLNCMYGFLSTYDETIFLRQELINGVWQVSYSPVIKGSTSYVPSNATNVLGSPVVSVKQCFLYLASLAVQQGPVFNNTPQSQWFLD